MIKKKLKIIIKIGLFLFSKKGFVNFIMCKSLLSISNSVVHFNYSRHKEKQKLDKKHGLDHDQEKVKNYNKDWSFLFSKKGISCAKSFHINS
jgi:hypothetical protein